jgi:hypothetical protein
MGILGILIQSQPLSSSPSVYLISPKSPSSLQDKLKLDECISFFFIFFFMNFRVDLFPEREGYTL